MNECLQPPPPSRYRGPTVVQPRWRVGATLATLAAGDAEERLRAQLCEAYGVRHCLLLDRARSGLYLLVEGFGLRGPWLMPSVMHRPTAVVLRQHAASVTLADCDKDFNLCPIDAARALPAGAQALLATHTYGKAAQISQLRALADARGAFLLENAVHAAPWMDVEGRRLGAWGDAALLSFNVDKPLGALLGGALLTNRDDVWAAVSRHPLAQASRKELRNRLTTTFAAYRLKPALLRVPGLGARWAHATDGVAEIASFAAGEYRQYAPRRIAPLQAAAALSVLRELAPRLAGRRAAAARLRGLLEDTGLGLPTDTTSAPHGFLYFPVVLPSGVNRFAVGEALARAGFETKWRYHPLHLQPDLKLSAPTPLLRSEELWRQHLTLPLPDDPQAAWLEPLARAVRAALSEPARA